MVVYQIPPGMHPTQSAPFFIKTPQGGKVWVDNQVSALLEFAPGKTFQEILRTFPRRDRSKKEIGVALICLAEAGFLLREEGQKAAEPEKVTGPKVSVILVGFNSRKWLEECLPSLLAQNYSPLEIILVDNGSRDGTGPWLRDHFPFLFKLFRFPAKPVPGQSHQPGNFLGGRRIFPLLNPDVRLEKDAVIRWAAVTAQREYTAAAAGQTQIWWAPAFLNGWKLCGGLFLGNLLGTRPPGPGRF